MTLAIGRPRFVTVDDALAWHALLIEQYGGSQGLRDVGLLESALAQPRAAFGGEHAHAFPFEMAAAYAFHLAMNHPFVDGNKRMALLCAGSFLRMNGWNLLAEGEEAADAVLDLVGGRTDKAAFARWLEAHARLRPTLELRDFFRGIDPAVFVDVYRAARPDAPGNSQAQFQATADEVARAFPLIHALLELNRAAVAARDENQRIGTAMMILSFCALYRIAEDIGYEW